MDRTDEIKSSYMNRMARQIPIFGVEGQKKIAKTPIAIVGCGGSGSLAAYVCALLGFCILYLFDPDKWEIHNLNRSMLVGVKDIGTYKATSVKAKLETLFPEMQIKAFNKDIRSPGIWDQAKRCKWILGTVDNDDTRMDLQKKCSEDGKSLISIASGNRVRDNRVIGAGGRANRFAPGDACTMCQAGSDEPIEQTGVSLVLVNLVAVALGVDILLREITNYDKFNANSDSEFPVNGSNSSISRPSDNFFLFDLFSRTLESERIVPSQYCPYGCCNSRK